MRHETGTLEPDSALRFLLSRLALFALAVGLVVLGLVGTRPRAGELIVPVQGISATELRDSFDDPRPGGRRHRAIDIPAEGGTAVLASDDGVVFRLHESPSGGLSIYQWDATGERCFFYGHLSGYREGLVEGAPVRRGEILGFVGSTGNASPGAPHLHFEIHARDGSGRCPAEALNPYDFFLPS